MRRSRPDHGDVGADDVPADNIDVAPFGARAKAGDVAALAGVSKSTVSRAFARPESVRLDTRQRVMNAASDLGYSPNRAAQLLATSRGTGKRTGCIGLFVPDIANPGTPPLIKNVQALARQNGLSVFIADSDEHAENEVAVVSAMARQVDGIILQSPRAADDEVQRLLNSVPVVTVNRVVERASAVLYNDQGLHEAIEHLWALGHRRVAYLAGPVASYSNGVRRAALAASAAEFGIELVELGPFHPSYPSGTRAADLISASKATAAIAFNDLIALGLIAAYGARGVVVGRDVSIVGIDDIWLAGVMHPQLTTVRIPAVEAGAAAVRILLRQIEFGARAKIETIELPTSLLVRTTTGYPVKRI